MLKPFLATLTCLWVCYSTGSAQVMNPGQLQQSLQLLKTGKADTGRATLLLHLSKHYIFKAGELKSDMDSAGLLLQQAYALSRQLSYQKGIAGYYLQMAILSRESGSKEKGRRLTDSAILLCHRYKAFDLLGECYFELRQYFEWQDSVGLDTIRICYEKALTAYQQAGNIEKQASCLQNLADLDQLQQDYAGSISRARRAITLYKSIGYQELQGAYDLLNACYSEISDYPSAIQYGLLAARAAENAGDTSLQLCTIYNRLGTAFYRSKTNYPEALKYGNKALALAKKHHHLNSIYVIAPQLVNTYLASNLRPEALAFARQLIKDYPPPADNPPLQLVANRMLLIGYTITKNYTAAQQYCDKMLALYQQPGMNKFYGRLDIVRFYMLSKQYSNAEASLLVHNELLTRPNINADVYIYNREWWFTLDSTRGKFLSAISYLQQQKRAEDSVHNVNRSKIIETLKVEYELEKKDKDIQLKTKSIDLLTSTSALQQQQIQRSTLVQRATIAGVLLLVGFLALLYNRYQLKLKASKQIADKNAALQHLVEEKEWLLKEIHHRVKNNLQTIVSLLESQSAYLNNSEALLAIQDSQNRVYAMSLIHQKLYQTDNVAAINMGGYLTELVQYLRESFTIRQQIQFQLEVLPIELDVSQAVPLGLILNEAITNSIKYAFPSGSIPHPAITIRMIKEDKLVSLIVSDNGVGLPMGFDVNKSSGLGLKLMRGLTEDIEGRFSIQSNKGSVVSICFTATTPLDKGSEAVYTHLIGETA